tara:strand:+ start:211 stop:1392 length:1182 start_codon:yes stop_codon:yes gene_type:complete
MKKILLLVFLVIPFIQIAMSEEIPDYDKPYAPIFFDKSVYSWTEKIKITIIAPSWNTGMNLIDSIGGDPNYSIDVSTNKYQLKEYKLYETDPSSGIFTGEVILTGFLHDVDGDGDYDTNPRTTGTGPNGGYLQNDEDSGITVSFEFADGVILSESVKIQWNKGDLKILDANQDSAKIKLFDRDMNLNPESVDTVNIDIFSENDSAGINIEIIETEENSGIFEGTITITQTDQSSGDRLYALPDSEITAKYSDRTLPRPFTTSDELDIFATYKIFSDTPSIERLQVSQTGILTPIGEPMQNFNIYSTGMFFSEIENTLDHPQNFVYIVQIKDEKNDVVSLSWISGQIMSSQKLTASVSWTPQESGKYSIDRFIWSSMKDAIPLSDLITKSITIQ